MNPFIIITQVIIEILVISLFEDCVIFTNIYLTRCQNTGITRDASGFSSSRLNRNFALRGTGLVYSHYRKIA